MFEKLHYPPWVVTVVLTLLAYGCPVAAIVAALQLDERIILAWQAKAGQQGKRLQEEVVCQGQDVLDGGGLQFLRPPCFSPGHLCHGR